MDCSVYIAAYLKGHCGDKDFSMIISSHSGI